jgi:hypothetical protein
MVLVSASHTGGVVDKMWEVDEKERGKMRDDMFSSVDRDNNDRISSEELSRFCIAKKDHILEKWPPIFHGILKDDIRQLALDEFDTDGNKGLSKGEFENFSGHLEKQYLKYLQRAALLKFRAFWGLGHEPLAAPAWRDGYARVEQDEGPVAPDAGRWGVFLGLDPDIPAARKWTCTIVAPGWWEDLKYYSANNHPLHGIFMCDPAHPLDWRERVMMEVVVFCLTYASLYAHKRCMYTQYGLDEKFGLDETTFNLLCVTLPGMVLWYVLFYMYTCPCANVDEIHSTRCAQATMKCLRIFSEDVAHTIVLFGFLYLVWHLHVNASTRDLRGIVLPVCVARARGYAISWLLMLFVYFNPLVAWGQPHALARRGALDTLADLVGLGQWRVEKMRFQSLRGGDDPESAGGQSAARGNGRWPDRA